MTADAEPVAVREMTPADVPAALRLTAAAGWNQREEDWRVLLAGNPRRFVVAERDGHVVGSGGAVCYGTSLAWVCMILVEASERGQGVGTRLVEGVLARVSDVARVGLDATPQGRGVYARLGFVETGRLWRMAAPSPSVSETAAGRARAAAAEVRPLAPRDVAPVFALDREVFGADRSLLLRWSAARAPAFCAGAEGQAEALAGYSFSRRGARSYQVGPIVAHDVASARALLDAAVVAADGAPVVVDAPADREDWLAELRAAGFAEERPLVRMYRAGARPPGRPELQLAIFGPEFG